MCSLSTTQNLLSHLLSSLLLAFVAAIPNHTLRYSALALTICLSILCTIHLRSPSTKLRHLAIMIDTTDELLRRAGTQSPRIYFSLTEQMVQLLEVNKTASLIKCRILNSQEGQFSWTNYRALSNAIAACGERVESVHTGVQLIMEAEHQRRVDDNIGETQFILATSLTA
ncbi:hypothetical protein B0H14DRAFT_3435401 [Mycena olivaceomarginata]|nr:hypothetical protein B0H14DRAFT_3435401 [Mycena olivaceomarginata]